MNNKRTLYVLTCIFLVAIMLAILGMIKHAQTTQQMQREIDKYKAEVEDLKTDVDYWSMAYADLQEDCDELKHEADGYISENLKLKHKLAEYEEEEESDVQTESKTLLKGASKPQPEGIIDDEAATRTKANVEIKESTKSATGLTDSEIYMLAQLIYLEGGNTSYDCQLAIGSVVLNLMKADGVSLKTEIYTPGRFSVASRVSSTKPSDTSLKAAKQLAENGPTLPSSVKCFRNNHYFSWCKPYCAINNVYFGSY